MSELDFVRYLNTWYEARRSAEGEAGVTLRFGQSDDDRPKPSAWVAAQRRGRESNLTLWSTGEAEFLAGRPGHPEVDEHSELQSTEELDALLERLLAFVRE